MAEDELRKEIEELKKQNESLRKLLATVYNKLGINDKEIKTSEKEKKLKRGIEDTNREKKEQEELNEKEIEIPITGFEDIDEEEIDTDQQWSPEGKESMIIIDSSSLKETIEPLLRSLNKEIKQTIKKIKEENEKIRTVPFLTGKSYEEVKEDLERLKDKLKDLRYEFKKIQRTLWKATKEIKRLKAFSITEGYREGNKGIVKNIGTIESEILELTELLEEIRKRLKEANSSYISLLKRVHVIRKGSKGKKASIYFSDDFNLGEIISTYVENIIGSTMKNLEKALQNIIPPDLGKWKYKQHRETTAEDITEFAELIKIDDKTLADFLEKASLLFSALGDKNRLKILKVLEEGPEFQKELSEKTGLKGGTFKHHTDLLKESRFITREAVRGRYLITRLGFEAIKLAELLYSRYKLFLEKESEIDDKEEE